MFRLSSIVLHYIISINEIKKNIYIYIYDNYGVDIMKILLDFFE